MRKKKISKVVKTSGSKIREILILQKKEQQPWGNYRKNRIAIYQCNCSEVNKQDNEVNKEKKIKTNRTGLSNGKLLPYQDKKRLSFESGIQNSGKFYFIKNYKLSEKSLNGQYLKTFQLNYKLPLPKTSRDILNSFNNKYIYYAIDDILYLLNSNPIERDNLLNILYSCMISLHNEFSINFFDIWIDSIYFNDICETNRFLKSQIIKNNQTSNLIISVKLHYFKRIPIKKPEPIW